MSLHQRYSGANAAEYEAKRFRGKRALAEDAAFTELIKEAQAHSVFDCPFGTGRWLDWYRRMEGPVIGLDISGDMLAVARNKLAADPMPNAIVAEGDLFTANLRPFADLGVELVVCTRFLNWLPAKDAELAISRLSHLGAAHAIIGCSVRPQVASWLERLRMKYVLYRTNRSGDVRQHVHDERQLLKWFERSGWRVGRRLPIFQNPSRQNFFYLLARAL